MRLGPRRCSRCACLCCSRCACLFQQMFAWGQNVFSCDRTRTLPRLSRALPRLSRALPRFLRALPRFLRALPQHAASEASSEATVFFSFIFRGFNIDSPRFPGVRSFTLTARTTPGSTAPHTLPLAPTLSCWHNLRGKVLLKTRNATYPPGRHALCRMPRTLQDATPPNPRGFRGVATHLTPRTLAVPF